MTLHICSLVCSLNIERSGCRAHLSGDSTLVFASSLVETYPTYVSCSVILDHQLTIVVNPQLSYDDIVGTRGHLAPSDVVSVSVVAQMAHSGGQNLNENTNKRRAHQNISSLRMKSTLHRQRPRHSKLHFEKLYILFVRFHDRRQSLPILKYCLSSNDDNCISLSLKLRIKVLTSTLFPQNLFRISISP